eukprot:gene3783-6944_t
MNNSTEDKEAQVVNDSKLAQHWLKKQREHSEDEKLISLKHKRVDHAANWMDKEINKLIDIIKENGIAPNYEITYKELFMLTEKTMEALSGTLKLGKKRGVFIYSDKIELLLQGRDDNIVIKLAKTNFIETEKKYIDPEKVQHLDLKMSKEEIKNIKIGDQSNSICSICLEKVLITERVVDHDRILHPKCFKCTHCGSLLNISKPFANLDGNYYCIPHYTQLFSVNADYIKGFSESKKK